MPTITRRRLILGLSTPIVSTLAGYWLIERGLYPVSSGFEIWLGLMLIAALTGNLMPTRWVVIYPSALYGAIWGFALAFEIGGFTTEGYESWQMLATEIAVLLTFVAFGANTGRELGRLFDRQLVS